MQNCQNLASHLGNPDKYFKFRKNISNPWNTTSLVNKHTFPKQRCSSSWLLYFVPRSDPALCKVCNLHWRGFPPKVPLERSHLSSDLLDLFTVCCLTWYSHKILLLCCYSSLNKSKSEIQTFKPPPTSSILLPPRDYHLVPIVLHLLIKECISSALQH